MPDIVQRGLFCLTMLITRCYDAFDQGLAEIFKYFLSLNDKIMYYNVIMQYFRSGTNYELRKEVNRTNL